MSPQDSQEPLLWGGETQPSTERVQRECSHWSKSQGLRALPPPPPPLPTPRVRGPGASLLNSGVISFTGAAPVPALPPFFSQPPQLCPAFLSVQQTDITDIIHVRSQRVGGGWGGYMEINKAQPEPPTARWGRQT